MKYLLLPIILLLPACGALDKRQEVHDKALDAAEQLICEDASVGSIRRKFGVSEESAKTWQALCSKNTEFLP